MAQCNDKKDTVISGKNNSVVMLAILEQLSSGATPSEYVWAAGSFSNMIVDLCM